MKTDEKQSCKLDVGRVFQQKAGGNFYYRYQIDGMRKCVSLDTQDLDEAIKYVKTKLMPVVMATDVDVVAAIRPRLQLRQTAVITVETHIVPIPSDATSPAIDLWVVGEGQVVRFTGKEIINDCIQITNGKLYGWLPWRNALFFHSP